MLCPHRRGDNLGSYKYYFIDGFIRRVIKLLMSWLLLVRLVVPIIGGRLFQILQLPPMLVTLIFVQFFVFRFVDVSLFFSLQV